MSLYSRGIQINVFFWNERSPESAGPDFLVLILQFLSLNLFDGKVFPYLDHTRTHAADVMQGVYYLTTNQVPCSGSRHILGSHDFSDETTETTETTECMNHPMTECALGAISDQIPGIEHMSLLVAAAMHDYDHPGMSKIR